MFDKLLLKQLKDIIREYKLTTQIKMSRLVDGKRKPYTKKELSNELHNHLEIRDDGEIIYKSHDPMKERYLAPQKKVRIKEDKGKQKEEVVENVVVAPSKENTDIIDEIKKGIARNEKEIDNKRKDLFDYEKSAYYPEINNALNEISGENPNPVARTRKLKAFTGLNNKKVSTQELNEKAIELIKRNPPDLLRLVMGNRLNMKGEIVELERKNDRLREQLNKALERRGIKGEGRRKKRSRFDASIINPASM